MNAIVAFSFQDCPLRVERDADGEPLFHAGDLCAILEYANPRDAVRRHVDECDVVKRDVTSDSDKPTARKTQQVNYVREPGMWSLVLGSETAAAKPVKRWVTSEVLPSIRKTGRYVAPGAPDASVDRLTQQVARLQSDVAALKKRQAPREKRDTGAAVQARVVAWLVRRTPVFCGPDQIARTVLGKVNLTAEERAAVERGIREAGYRR